MKISYPQLDLINNVLSSKRKKTEKSSLNCGCYLYLNSKDNKKDPYVCCKSFVSLMFSVQIDPSKATNVTYLPAVNCICRSNPDYSDLLTCIT